MAQLESWAVCENLETEMDKKNNVCVYSPMLTKIIVIKCYFTAIFKLIPKIRVSVIFKV